MQTATKIGDHVAFASMSLSDYGMLRRYASCCNTPIGNTPRDIKTSYVGLVHSCLASNSPSLQESFGPIRMVLNTKSAKGYVQATPLRNLVAMVGLMKSVIRARLNGTYKRNPFLGKNGHTHRATPRTFKD